MQRSFVYPAHLTAILVGSGQKLIPTVFFVPIVSATGTCEKLAVSNFLGRPSREGYSFQLLVDYQSTLLRYHTTRLESSIVSPYYLRFFLHFYQTTTNAFGPVPHFKWHELKTFFFSVFSFHFCFLTIAI